MTAALPDRRALAGLIAGAICIGFAPIFVRWVDVGLTAAAFWRTALALPLLAVALAMPGARAGSGGGSSRGLLLAGLFFAADLAVWHQSIHYTSVANATLLANLAPVFVAAAGAFWLGERVTPRFVAGLAVALAGAALLVADSFTISLRTVGGDLLGALTAVFYAGYQLTVTRVRRHATTAQVMAWSTLACAAALLPLTLLLGEPLWPRSAQGWAVLAGLALVSQVLGQGLIAWAMAHLPATFSSVSLLVQPLAAALLAALLLGERFGALQAAGGVLVIAGIVACRLAVSRAEPAPA
ncbi:MAG TPA: DMT family transporter [Candidatus Binatia bacterium]|nr:DMT family transporter [Candidatus Binatia bacterium]